MRCKTSFLILLLTIISGLPIVPVPAFGASTTNQMQVSATIPDWGYCYFTTPGPFQINFNPALNPLSPVERSASVTFSVKCNFNIWKWLLSGNQTTVIIERSGSSQLYLTKGSDRIPYNLNLPTSKTVNNGSSSEVTLTATIPENSYITAPAGNYSDTIIINIEP